MAEVSEVEALKTDEDGLTTTRLEAFSDGVFAIAITLLILEVHIPEGAAHGGGGQERFSLASGLLSIWPSYFAYVLSFIMIGIYWANHHYLYRLYRRTDHIFNLLNVVFLMCISFLPLPTATLGKYMTDDASRRSAAIFYGLGMFLPAFFWCLSWLYASQNFRLLDKRLDEAYVRYLTRLYVISTAVYAGVFLLAFLSPYLSLALNVGLTILYSLPPRKAVYRS